ncbi:tetratricopeptide repeat protein [uncultured Chryseobacterium sp.]|uniref:tetratricopeptide repeat protein n=1 Tax=uncultured Chryseobacterium sp. TaxID=259322 RepID=UPI002588B682|nr:tetratricopeptide repeat protein [uncultured Chryseobacterium sp.]
MMKKIIFIIVFFVINFSVFKAQKYNTKQIDSLIAYAEDFSRKMPNKAVKLNEQNYKIAQKANYTKGIIKCLNLLSSCNINLGNYEMAFVYAKQTQEEALQINDYKNVCNGLINSARINSALGLENEAQEIMNKAFSVIDKIQDKDDFHEISGSFYTAEFDMMAYSTNGITSLSKFFEFAKSSISEYSKIKKTETRNKFWAIANSNLGYAYAERKMYDSAFYYANNALSFAENDKSTYNICVALNILAYISKKQNKYQQAISYVERLIPLAKQANEPNLLAFSYTTVLTSYEKLGNKEKQLEYLTSYARLNDSLNKILTLRKDLSIQKIVKEKEEEFIDEKEDLYLLITVICLFSALAYYFGYNVFVNYKLEKKEKQQKENIIKEKESQLTELKQKINVNFDELLELAKKDDSSFLTRFSEAYPDFILKLNGLHTSLTSGQLKFCAFLKLNFSTKEIAHYSNISIRSVEIKKGRLRKQLNIPSSEDLNKWMMNL